MAKQSAKAKPKARPKKDGIPVDNLLVQSFCGRCHTRDDRDHMTRISYVRKSPEGWSRTIKRMGRLHGLQLTPDAAKALVRTLSNTHGLARSEAARGLYDSERRVHWSEEHHSEDFRRACAQCHPLGRALLQHRDKEEWQLLRATHVAMFPLSSRQMGGGPPRPSRSRRARSGSTGSGSSSGSGSSGSGGGSANSARRSSSLSVGDRVLAQLTKDQPLFTEEWLAWTQNLRQVPLAGVWTVTGHETGRGDVIGTLTMKRTAPDEYDLIWNLRWTDGSAAERAGKGVLYAGYSWRGRSRDADGTAWREVLLLDEAWQSFRGRLFTGAYDEIGVDVTLHRDTGRPRVVGLINGAVEVPAKGAAAGPTQRVEVIANAAFPDPLLAEDFFVGEGLRVVGVERLQDRHVALSLEVLPGTKLGTRLVAYGTHPGGAELTLYDTVDYVRIRPLQGLSRIGGAKHPRQLERFEAYAVHRGNDGKPYTKDDVDLFQVRPKWSLQEFRVRDHDDDLQYVGSIDASTGVFTPGLDGPNPKRKWQANNIGDVFVCCEISLDVPVRPEAGKDKDTAADKGIAEGDEPNHAETSDAETSSPETSVAGEAEPAAKPVARLKKRFFARSHLIVTVPLYARWQVLDWEDR